jgi:hypothetical protein
MNTLNETNYQDLPLEVLNVDIHNSALFMFLSMLKCSVMGNYKLRENAYVARESVYQETKYFDAVWYNPKDEWDQLLIEMKTRKVGDHEVEYIDRIIKDVMSKIGGLLGLERVYIGSYVVPIIIYKKAHRSFDGLWNADMLMMWGNKEFHCNGPILSVKKWHSIIAKTHDIDDLMDTLDKVYHEEIHEEINDRNEVLAEEEQEEQEEQKEQEDNEVKGKSIGWGNGSQPAREERRFSLTAIAYMVMHYLLKINDQLVTVEEISERVKRLSHPRIHKNLRHPSWWKESLPKMIRDDLIKMIAVNDLDTFEVTKDNIIKGENSRTFFNFKIEDYQLLIESKEMSDEELECLKIPLSQHELIREEVERLNDSE